MRLRKLQISILNFGLLSLTISVGGCATSGSGSLGNGAATPSDAARPAPVVVPAPKTSMEDRDWDAAVEPFDSAKVASFLQAYPNGVHAKEASQIIEDEKIIEKILASGPGSHFVLPGNSTPPFISNSAAVNKERGRVIIDAVNGKAQNVFGHTILGSIAAEGVTNPNQVGGTLGQRPLMPCGDLSVFEISGPADNIQGDASDPLRILYTKRYGVVQIGGKGKIFSIRDGALGDVIFQAP